MPEITLEKTLKEELIAKIQCYMEEELDKSLGSFEAEFLLDFLLRKWARILTIRRSRTF